MAVYTPTSELKPNGENPVFKKDVNRSFATGFDNTGKNDWIQTRIGIPEDVFGMCSMLEVIFG